MKNDLNSKINKSWNTHHGNLRKNDVEYSFFVEVNATKPEMFTCVKKIATYHEKHNTGIYERMM